MTAHLRDQWRRTANIKTGRSGQGWTLIPEEADEPPIWVAHYSGSEDDLGLRRTPYAEVVTGMGLMVSKHVEDSDYYWEADATCSWIPALQDLGARGSAPTPEAARAAAEQAFYQWADAAVAEYAPYALK